jgi:hypothetical protein
MKPQQQDPMEAHTSFVKGIEEVTSKQPWMFVDFSA